MLVYENQLIDCFNLKVGKDVLLVYEGQKFMFFYGDYYLKNENIENGYNF